MSAIKFMESLSKFMIPIALLKKFGSLIFITGIEIIHLTRHSRNLSVCMIGGFTEYFPAASITENYPGFSPPQDSPGQVQIQSPLRWWGSG